MALAGSQTRAQNDESNRNEEIIGSNKVMRCFTCSTVASTPSRTVRSERSPGVVGLLDATVSTSCSDEETWLTQLNALTTTVSRWESGGECAGDDSPVGPLVERSTRFAPLLYFPDGYAAVKSKGYAQGH
jgi:hypothetical protein